MTATEMYMTLKSSTPAATASLAEAPLTTGDKHVHVTPADPLFGWYIAVIIGLVLLGGMFSGLTLGLMGLDSVNLQVLSLAGTPSERKQAPKVLKLIQAGRHTMLVMLLLCNTLVNTSLPVFLDQIVGGGWIAVLASTFLELVFGGKAFRAEEEHCADHTISVLNYRDIAAIYGLAIGATFAPLVRALIYITYPISRPVGLLLDSLLGSHDDGVTYRKAELKTFVSLGVEDELAEDEVAILGSVLEFAEKVVEDIMTPQEDVFALSAETIMLDDELVAEILRKGYSRIPVYEPSSPGAFMIRALVGYDTSDLKPASALVAQALPQCPPDLPLLEAMAYFQTGRSHILLVTTSPGKDEGAVGVVTLEDVVEELIGKEIIDETDQFVDIHSRVPVVRPKHRDQTGSLKRIFEGRLARRRAVLDQMVKTGSLIDHPISEAV